VILDLAAPLRSLRALAGIGGEPLSPTAMARARGIKAPSIHDAERAGAGISIATLRASVEALGGTLEIRVTLPARVTPA
jgi:hypothetical protein